MAWINTSCFGFLLYLEKEERRVANSIDNKVSENNNLDNLKYYNLIFLGILIKNYSHFIDSIFYLFLVRANLCYTAIVDSKNTTYFKRGLK